jgi:hypothetical protein
MLTLQKIVLVAGFLLVCGLFFVLGLSALIDPVSYTQLHNRIFGDPIDFYGPPRRGFLIWHDPEAVRNSAGMRVAIRLQGALFALFGGGMMLAVLMAVLKH